MGGGGWEGVGGMGMVWEGSSEGVGHGEGLGRVLGEAGERLEWRLGAFVVVRCGAVWCGVGLEGEMEGEMECGVVWG